MNLTLEFVAETVELTQNDTNVPLVPSVTVEITKVKIIRM